MKGFRLAILVVLWVGFVVLVALLAGLSLKACGIRFLGYEISWCTASRQPDLSRLNDLQRQLHTLIEMNGQMGAQCGPVERASVPAPLESIPAGGNSAVGAIGGASARPPASGPVLPSGAPASAAGEPANGDAAPSPNPTPLAEGDADMPATDGQGAAPSGEGAMPLPEPAPHRQAAGGGGAGGAGGAAGGGGGGGGTPPAGAGGAGGTPPPGGGNGGAAAGSPPPSTDSQSSEPPPQCPDGKPKLDYVVLALDHSKSMGLPVEMDSELATRLENTIENGGPDAWKASNTYNDYIARPGRKRLDEVKSSVGEVTRRLPPETRIGVVTFAGCNGVVDMGDYDQGRRERLISKINQLQTKPATPAADALKIAMEKASRVHGGRVIFVSDGKDTCDADPCAVAKQSSGVQVDVISLGGGQALSCVARATGGKLVEPAKEAQSLQQILVELGLNGARGGC
ncbi:VWA domain-containing protein [uncultured Cohaesibacter sp.]|uniref:vWA domain-containing protein n=1 Tax=uncultured Cohaesibacter sp. TaxID=1002546 RepID=UPI002AA8B2EE|nr:VWA domain-containing protein [uncultured Cohaesibacter sp.]